jgi:hypothetical protein
LPTSTVPIAEFSEQAGTPAASVGDTESSEARDIAASPFIGASDERPPIETLALVPATKLFFSVASVVPPGQPAAPTAVIQFPAPIFAGVPTDEIGRFTSVCVNPALAEHTLLGETNVASLIWRDVESVGLPPMLNSLQLAALTPTGHAMLEIEMTICVRLMTAVIVAPCGMRVPLIVRPMSLLVAGAAGQPASPALQKWAPVELIVVPAKLVATMVRPSLLSTVRFVFVGTPLPPTAWFSVAVFPTPT